MVGRPAEVSTPPSYIATDLSNLGVIVDRSIFDDDEELTIPMDLPAVIDEERSYSDNITESVDDGVRIMKNGKVRRKLRWKPPGFRRNKNRNNISSNQSVVSALTARSTATNRSTSTARSIFSHFSRKSQNSFHTFHSTETPVVKNSRQSQHTFQRPNYNDTFESGMSGPSTIANEGRQVHKKIQESPRNGKIADNLSVEHPSQGVSMAISPMTQASVQFFDPFGESDAPVTTAIPSVVKPKSAAPPPPLPSGPKPRRPPLFKRKLHFGKKAPTSPKSTGTPSVLKATSSLSADGIESDTVPTIDSSVSPLSEAISLERQETFLPALESDDYVEDRRVSLGSEIPHRTVSSHVPSTHAAEEDIDSVHGSIASGNKSLNQEGGSVAATATSTSSSSASAGKSRTNVFVSPARNLTTNLSRRYNRPVDTTTFSSNTSRGSSEEGAADSPLSKQRRATVPVDLNNTAFLEAEHNLRAIHDMAAEHLAHGEYEEATEVFEEILRGQQTRYGNNSYRVGTALHNLGLVHMKSGKYDKAIEVCQKAVAVRKETLVPNHPDVAVSLAQLGVAHLENQDYEESLVCFQEALHIRRNYLGPRHPKCAKILNNIGCALYSLGNYEQALHTFEEALDIQRNALRTMSENPQENAVAGSNSTLLSVASTLCNLASIMSKRGEWEDAVLALEEALLVSCDGLAIVLLQITYLKMLCHSSPKTDTTVSLA